MWGHTGTAQDKTATGSRAKGTESGALDGITANDGGKEGGKALPFEESPHNSSEHFSSNGLHFKV